MSELPGPDSQATGREKVALYLGHKMDGRAEKLVPAITGLLGAQERLLGLFAVNGMRPLTDFVAVTSLRIVWGHSSDVTSRNESNRRFRLEFLTSQVRSVDIDDKGKSSVTLADGTVSKVPGLYHHAKDVAAARAAVVAMFAEPAADDVAVAAALAASDPTVFVPPPDGQPHLGRGHADDLPARLTQAQTFLVPGEHPRAVFAVNGTGTGNVRTLLFTTGRLLGFAGKSAETFEPAWHVPAGLEVEECHRSALNTYTLTVKTASGPQKVTLGQLKDDLRDKLAFDWYVRHLSVAGPDLDEKVAASQVLAPWERPAPPPPTQTSVALPAPTGTAVSLPPPTGDPVAMPAPAAPGQPSAPAYTAEEKRALADGVPEKAVSLVAPILTLFAKAEAAAADGDIVAEEGHLAQVSREAATAGLFARGKVTRWANDELARRVSRKRLRIGAEPVAAVGRSLLVFSDRILDGAVCRLMTEDVTASVEVDGQILQSSRPTLTRMAMGSVLPGSALLVGLAVPKTTTKDSRKARFIVASPSWTCVTALDPDRAMDTRPVAAQINAIAQSIGRKKAAEATAAAPAPSPVPELPAGPAGAGVGSQLDQLERIAALAERGVISAEEAARLRAQVLGG